MEGIDVTIRDAGGGETKTLCCSIPREIVKKYKLTKKHKVKWMVDGEVFILFFSNNASRAAEILYNTMNSLNAEYEVNGRRILPKFVAVSIIMKGMGCSQKKAAEYLDYALSSKPYPFESDYYNIWVNVGVKQ